MHSTTETIPEEQQSVSDAQLIQSAKNGKQSGYEQLVLRYQDRLFRSMLGNVGCPVVAEEVVQEAFIRAFRHLDSFEHRSNFYTWLYRIALNARRPYLRKSHRTIQLDSVGEQAPEMWTNSNDSPPGRAERHEDRNQVRDALARLDEHQRTILVLREFDGLDYQQIADVMQLNIGTVRSRLARARARLKKELTPYVASSGRCLEDVHAC